MLFTASSWFGAVDSAALPRESIRLESPAGPTVTCGKKTVLNELSTPYGNRRDEWQGCLEGGNLSKIRVCTTTKVGFVEDNF